MTNKYAAEKKWYNNRIILLGNTLEYFDLYLYIHFATVIAQKFFPAGLEKSLFLQAFSFSQIYLIAPISCLIFAYLGDKHGRKPIIIHTGMVMAVASTLAAILPSYEAWGEASMILLLVLRLIQGVALAGEPTAAAIYMIENAEIDRKAPFYRQSAWYLKVMTATEEFGGILALLACLLALHLSKQYEQAWRIPFVFCVFSVCTILWARFKLTESPEYVDATSNKSACMFSDGEDGFNFLRKVMIFSRRNSICLMLFLLPYPIVFNICMLQISPQVVGAEAEISELMTYNIFVAIGSISCNLIAGMIALKLEWNLRKTTYCYVLIGLLAGLQAIYGVENGAPVASIWFAQSMMLGLVNFTIIRPALLKVMPVVGRYSLMAIAWGLARFSGFFMMVFMMPYLKLNFGLLGCWYVLCGFCAVAIFAVWYHVCYYTIDIQSIKRSMKECNKSGLSPAHAMTHKEIDDYIGRK